MQLEKLTQILNNINFKLLLKNKNNYFLIVLINSFLFSIYYGYRGVYPIDSFLIFNAGYKVLNNFHPFKDYWTITGPLLDYIQSVLFLIFKINWFSYVLHAALINSLLATLSYYFFKKIGLQDFYSFIYSISISILAYPTTGTPFMDHHGVIFSLLSIYFLMLAIKDNKIFFWFFSSIFLVLSFFSKQIPSSYLVPLIAVIILIYLFFINKNRNEKYNIIFFILGGLLSVFFFSLIFYINNIPIKNFLIQYIYYPMSIGEDRIVNIKFDIKNVFLNFKFIYFSTIPLLFSLFFLIKKKTKGIDNKIDLVNIFIVLGSALIFIYTQIITKNQILIFFLIPFYLGMSHFYILKYFNKKYMLNIIILILIISTGKYHLRFNEHKKFMELEGADFKKAVDAGHLDKKLHRLKWITLDYKNNPVIELDLLKESIKILKADKDNKIIMTDYQIVPGLIKNTNYAPNKWFDMLSVPSKSNKYFDEYKSFFTSSLKKQKIKNIYLIGGGKLKFLLPMFEKKECLDFKRINTIFLKMGIEKCLL